jgi:hypothetical protein
LDAYNQALKFLLSLWIILEGYFRSLDDHISAGSVASLGEENVAEKVLTRVLNEGAKEHE